MVKLEARGREKEELAKLKREECFKKFSGDPKLFFLAPDSLAPLRCQSLGTLATPLSIQS